MYCKNCGNELSDKAFVCPKCGVKVKEDVPIGCGVGGGSGAASASSASSTTVVIEKGENDSGYLFPIITMFAYILLYPIGLILNIIGLFSGKRKGCFVSLFLVFFTPALLVVIFLIGAAIMDESTENGTQQPQTPAAVSTVNNNGH